MNVKNIETLQFLLVEDNEGDIELTKIAFEERCIENNLNIVTDGEEAFFFFAKKRTLLRRYCA